MALLVKVLLLCMPTQLYIYLIFSTSVFYILIRPFSIDCQLFKKTKQSNTLENMPSIQKGRCKDYNN